MDRDQDGEDSGETRSDAASASLQGDSAADQSSSDCDASDEATEAHTANAPTEIEHLRLAELMPYAANSRTHSAQQVGQIAASIMEFGFTNPVLIDEQGVIIAGHGRVLAADELQLDSVPCIRLRHLTEQQKRAYVIADNQLALNAGWDEELLQSELRSLAGDDFDLSLLGFEAGDIEDKLLAAIGSDDESTVADLDDVPEPPQAPVTRPGDLWILGSHRLLCGDSRQDASIARALNGELAGAVLTDPPYGVDYVGKTKDAMVIENDGASGLLDLLRQSLRNASDRCLAGGAWYVAAPAGPQFLEFATVLRELDVWRQTLVWVNQTLVLGRSDYHYQHEAIFYGWKPGAAHQMPPNRKQTTVWHFDKPAASRQHPTMKPVALYAQMLTNSTTSGSVVLEPFGGSGTTLIACEQLGRVCRALEFSPHYCDVIVERWQNMTGQKAIRASDGA